MLGLRRGGRAGKTHSAAAQAASAPARRGGQEPALHRILATKVLYDHLQNRHQLMDPPLSDLRGVSASEAMLLIRAMSVAANADGVVTTEERGAIKAALDSSDLSREQRERLEQDLAEPPCLESLVRQARDNRAAARFYAVSMRALDRGSSVNRAYSSYLAQRLGLPTDLVVRLNRQIGWRA